MVHGVGVFGHVFAQLLEDVQGFDVTGIGKIAFAGIVPGQGFRIHDTLADGAQIMGHGPGRGEAGGNGLFIAGCAQSVAHGIELIQSGGHGQVQLGKHILVVKEGFTVHGPRHAILLAVNLERRPLALHNGIPERRIGSQQIVPGLYPAGLDQVVGEAAGPGHEHIGDIVGGDEHADLFLVGVVEHLVGHDFDVGVFSFKLSDQAVEVAELGLIGPAVKEPHGHLIGKGRDANGQTHHDSQNQSKLFHGYSSFI